MTHEDPDRCPDCDHSLWDCVCWLADAQAATELRQRQGSTYCIRCHEPGALPGQLLCPTCEKAEAARTTP